MRIPTVRSLRLGSAGGLRPHQENEALMSSSIKFLPNFPSLTANRYQPWRRESTIFSRAALHAGNRPPMKPMINAKAMVYPAISGVSLNPKANSENVSQFTVEIVKN